LTQERLPHACSDSRSRLAKAAKIAALLRPRIDLRGASILDIGTGAGVIASRLSEVVGAEGEVRSVDVVDVRTEVDGYEFEQIASTTLPFDDGSFDIVISNHVIEHVGARPEQMHHLAEIERVVRKSGVAYLATPNRWAVIEPHFKLPFLGWLPTTAQSRMVRAFRRGDHYDCRLLSRRDALRLIRDAGLVPEDVTSEAVSVISEVEEGGKARFLKRVPASAVSAASRLSPTMVWLLRPKDSSS
jgi:2-polyprenyl-3-methyl-5-hydroxy-6-metoxy-1,4-benzoquinol methylase